MKRKLTTRLLCDRYGVCDRTIDRWTEPACCRSRWSSTESGSGTKARSKSAIDSAWEPPSTITPPESKNGQHLRVLADLFVTGRQVAKSGPYKPLASPVQVRALHHHQGLL